MLRMAHRLMSHHRALFSPKYLSGTSAYITTTSYFRAPFDVKDKDDFEKRVLASAKPVLVDFHAEYEFLLCPLKCSLLHSNLPLSGHPCDKNGCLLLGHVSFSEVLNVGFNNIIIVICYTVKPPFATTSSR